LTDDLITLLAPRLLTDDLITLSALMTAPCLG
jgi:hypothetical protein